MIHSLYIENGFPHHKKTFSFDSGTTTITGKNEAGKTAILEAIRFGLFGTKALRATTENYKGFLVKLEFEIRETRYRVHRSPVRCILSEYTDGKWADIASGKRAVDPAIRALFGYGLNVFDIANNCNQGAVEALGQLKPAERKRMVDETIGLTVLDQLGTWVGEQALASEKTATALEGTLVEPIGPEMPDAYKPSVELRLLVDQARRDNAERERLVGILSIRLNKPVKPKCEIAESVQILKELVSARQALKNDLDSTLARRRVLKLPVHSEERVAEFEVELERYQLWQEKERVYAGATEPTVSRADVKKVRSQWKAYDRWQEKQELLERGMITCPGCSLEFPLAIDALKKYDKVKEVVRPVITLTDCDAIEQIILKWESIDHERYKTSTIVAKPKYTQTQIREFRAQLAHESEIRHLDNLTVELESRLEQMHDYSPELAKRLEFEAHLKSYEKEVSKYEIELAEQKRAQTRYKELTGSAERLQKFSTELEASLEYENAKNAYETALGNYNTTKTEFERYYQRGVEMRKAALALKALRARIKGRLLPSLNRVSSNLLTLMTGGERNLVSVDEDFDINVDGQPLDVLSGSAKAVTNLSVRLALGQVLTNKVFSVFMGDELDASMDEDRAGYTMDCLRRLSDSIRQIIIVSHKRLDSDYEIRL